MSGWRKGIKTAIGASIGALGFSIAAAPVLSQFTPALTTPGFNFVQAATVGVPSAYGVNNATGQVDFGKLLTTILFPVLGGLLFIKGMRVIQKHI